MPGGLPPSMSGFDTPNSLMRLLDASDVAKLGEFFERNNRDEVTRFFHPFPMTSSTAAVLLQTGRRDLFFGMEVGDSLVAFSMLRGWDDGFDIPSFGIVVDFYQQRRGLGRRLTEWTLRWADQIGCAMVRLTSYLENQTACRLYTSLGFKEVSRDLDINGFVRLVMNRVRRLSLIPVYISTQCLPQTESLRERLGRLYAAGLHHIELSAYPVGNELNFPLLVKTFPGRLMLHHFFPSDKGKMVLNLASMTAELRRESLKFYQRSIDWSAACGAPFFSVHAGYISDPIGRDEHGFVFSFSTEKEKKRALTNYLQGLTELARYARTRGVVLLVENNVLTEQNKGKLLLSDPEEFQIFLSHWPIDLPIGILLDWGHWQITSRTLKLDLDGFSRLNQLVVALHLHGNDTFSDQHRPFVPDRDIIKKLQKFSPAFVTMEGRYAGVASLQAAVLEIEKVMM